MGHEVVIYSYIKTALSANKNKRENSHDQETCTALFGTVLFDIVLALYCHTDVMCYMFKCDYIQIWYEYAIL